MRNVFVRKESETTHRKSILYHLHILDPALDNSTYDDGFD
jgi:hypothetical protein